MTCHTTLFVVTSFPVCVLSIIVVVVVIDVISNTTATLLSFVFDSKLQRRDTLAVNKRAYLKQAIKRNKHKIKPT